MKITTYVNVCYNNNFYFYSLGSPSTKHFFFKSEIKKYLHIVLYDEHEKTLSIKYLILDISGIPKYFSPILIRT